MKTANVKIVLAGISTYSMSRNMDKVLYSNALTGGEGNTNSLERSDDPVKKPSEKPDEKEAPVVDLGDPEISTGEKEKIRKEIPLIHPGNEKRQ